MALMQRMDLRQGQSLVMTPQLQQAIKLLQMSNLELQAYVEGELERNPLLERDERGSDVQKSETRELDADTVSALNSSTSQEDKLRTLDTDLENVYTHEARADASSRESQAPAEFGLGLAPPHRAEFHSTATSMISAPRSPRRKPWPSISPTSSISISRPPPIASSARTSSAW